MEDFNDNLVNDDLMDEDPFEDSFEEDLEMDEQITDDSEFDDETDPAESEDEKFTASDAFIVGGAMGYAYHEGRRERKRRKLSDDSE